jgi:TonB family protein
VTRKALVTATMIFFFGMMPAAGPISARAQIPQQTGDNTAAARAKPANAPKCKYCPTAPYSEAARQLKIQGKVVLSATIGTDGRAHNVVVKSGLGYGLDEKALQTVRDDWKFEPAKGPDGKPTAARIVIEVAFHLY